MDCSLPAFETSRPRSWAGAASFPGVSAPNSRSPAVARRLPRPTTCSAGAMCNRRVTACIREFGARGRAVRRGQGRDERAPGSCEAPSWGDKARPGGGWGGEGLVAARNLAMR
jgi:hypothetical protein